MGLGNGLGFMHGGGLSRNQVQQISAKNLKMTSPCGYVYLEETFDNLDNWVTTNGGPASVSENVCSLADTTTGQSFFHLIFSGENQKYSPPADRKYMVETTLTSPIDQKLLFGLSNSTGYITYMYLTASSGAVTLLGAANGSETATLTNFVSTEKFRCLILVDPVLFTASFYFMWKDSVSGLERIEKIGTDRTFTSDIIDRITFATGGTQIGTITIEKVKIYSPWGIVIGDSQASGKPGWSPVPSLGDGIDSSSMAYWIEQATNNTRKIMTMGIGGASSGELLDRYNDAIINIYPEWVLINIGTNDCYGGGSVEISQSNVTTIIDGCITAGIKVYINEITPRNTFDSTMDAWASEWNTWLRVFSSSRPDCTVVFQYNILEDPNNIGKILPQYNADDTHFTVLGYRRMAEQVWNALIVA